MDGSYSFPIHRKLRREGRQTVSETSLHSAGPLPLPGEAGCQGRVLVRPASEARAYFQKPSRRARGLLPFLRGTTPTFRANRSEASEGQRDGLIVLWSNPRHRIKDRTRRNGRARTVAARGWRRDAEVHRRVAQEGRFRVRCLHGAPGSHTNDDPPKHCLSWMSLWINSVAKES